mmetsp:Transcript_281/g.275  ORF Transcript_281/g.275 Transcript_281/m.275 type:complete len:103 (-) Transcript_281:73-381(-)
MDEDLDIEADGVSSTENVSVRLVGKNVAEVLCVNVEESVCEALQVRVAVREGVLEAEGLSLDVERVVEVVTRTVSVAADIVHVSSFVGEAVSDRNAVSDSTE